LKVLLVHLLKWQAQAHCRSSGWRATITEQRGRIHSILARNPGLKPRLPELVDALYDRARADAGLETNLPLARFPETPPFTAGEIINSDFLPE